jgi:hypothetical protein
METPIVIVLVDTRSRPFITLWHWATTRRMVLPIR